MIVCDLKHAVPEGTVSVKARTSWEGPADLRKAEVRAPIMLLQFFFELCLYRYTSSGKK